MADAHRQQLRDDALAIGSAERQREDEAEQRRRDQLPAGDADAGRGIEPSPAPRPYWGPPTHFGNGFPHDDN